MPSLVASLLFSFAAAADEIRVAVASNFAKAMADLAADFEQATGHMVVPAFGSTGRHYAQIRNGAPFDAFFAADAERPRLLEDAGLTIAGSRFTYAIGQIALWRPSAGQTAIGPDALSDPGFRHLAIANPKLAPYGVAARQVLSDLGLWAPLQGRLVRGENIAQTFQFVASGNADLGFVAVSQIKSGNGAVTGAAWIPPIEAYRPIVQQAVLLKNGDAARAFMKYVKDRDARAVIERHGYRLPD